MKEAILIPGNGEQIYDPATRDYSGLVTELQDAGFRVHGIEVDWDQPYDVWVSDTEKRIAELDLDVSHTSLLGFSFGALIALGVSNRLSASVLGLASLSPHGGRGSMDALDAAINEPGYSRGRYSPDQYDAFEAMDVDELAANSLAHRALVMFGENETEILRSRCLHAGSILSDATVIEVPGVKHKIDDPAYSRAFVTYVSA